MPFFIRTKTNRLKLPDTLKKLPGDKPDTSGTVINWCGMPVAKIGDYVHSGNGVSAGTVGRLVDWLRCRITAKKPIRPCTVAFPTGGAAMLKRLTVSDMVDGCGQ